MANPSPAVAQALRNRPNTTPADRLTILQDHARQARDLELQLAALDEQRSDLQERLRKLYHETLPDMLDDAKLDHIGVPPEGNKPGVDYKLRPYYSASIAASWEPEKREAAFNTLKRLHAEDLIKTEVSARLPKGKLKVAKQLIAAAKQLKVTADLKLSVHSGTLTSWLRGIYEDGRALSATDLAAIGGSVGRMVKPEDRKS